MLKLAIAKSLLVASVTSFCLDDWRHGLLALNLHASLFMDFFLKLKGYKKYYGMDVSLMKGDETLDTITISDDEGSGKKLTFETEESRDELFGDNPTAEFKVVSQTPMETLGTSVKVRAACMTWTQMIRLIRRR